jgi:hypothetical protein
VRGRFRPSNPCLIFNTTVFCFNNKINIGRFFSVFIPEDLEKTSILVHSGFLKSPAFDIR